MNKNLTVLTIQKLFVLLIASSYGSTIIGCGGSNGDTVPVAGTIQYQGEPVPGIEVIFTPEVGSRPSTGSTNTEGHFVLNFSISKSGVIPGKQAVTFDWDTTDATPTGAIKAILDKHGAYGEDAVPYEIEITKGVKDLVINIE